MVLRFEEFSTTEKIVKRGNKWHVMVKNRTKGGNIKKTKSGNISWRTAGTHNTEKAAKKQMAAIEISKAGG